MKNKGCTAIIVAAGNSSRMKEIGNKQLLPIFGVPVLIRTLRAFEAAKSIDKIIVVTHRDILEEVSSLVKKYAITKLFSVTEGGATRQASVLNGLIAAAGAEFVAIHDGARPFIKPEKIDEAAEFAKENGSAVLAIPLSDTAKEIDENQVIKRTPDRNALRLVQTPQIFPLSVLKEAYAKAEKDGFCGTDDSSLVERLGKDVKTIFGDFDNIKITTPEDVLRAEAILKGATPMKIGFGYDVHAFCENRPLILGGVQIPHETGLLGHSDADVLIHAAMDALLGAAALGDIGKLFPDTSDEFSGIDSRVLLRRVKEVLREHGFSVNNLDITVAAQSPKLAPYIEKMRENISLDLEIPLSAVSVKATTTEHLGFEGRKEGISAYAISSIL